MSHRRIRNRSDAGCGHHADVEVYVRTWQRFGAGADVPDSDLVTMCVECYARLHNHPGCPGCADGFGCFHPGIGRKLQDLMDYERDICADLPFEQGWNDRQRERFRRLHDRQIQEQWVKGVKPYLVQ